MEVSIKHTGLKLDPVRQRKLQVLYWKILHFTFTYDRPIVKLIILFIKLSKMTKRLNILAQRQVANL